MSRGGGRRELGFLLAVLLVACVVSMVLQVGLVAIVASYAFAGRAAIELLRTPGDSARRLRAARARRRCATTDAGFAS